VLLTRRLPSNVATSVSVCHASLFLLRAPLFHHHNRTANTTANITSDTAVNVPATAFLLCINPLVASSTFSSLAPFTDGGLDEVDAPGLLLELLVVSGLTGVVPPADCT